MLQESLKNSGLTSSNKLVQSKALSQLCLNHVDAIWVQFNHSFANMFLSNQERPHGMGVLGGSDLRQVRRKRASPTKLQSSCMPQVCIPMLHESLNLHTFLAWTSASGFVLHPLLYQSLRIHGHSSPRSGISHIKSPNTLKF